MTLPRPDRLVAVLGTGTGVGKTWVAARIIERLQVRGVAVSARKPAQSFVPGELTDAEILGRASGEAPNEVCPPHRWYERPMAPPMAAEALGRPTFTVADLAGELDWPGDVAVGVIEGAGGARSPLAADGDSVDLLAAVQPDQVVLVADAGLGTLNLVRMSVDALDGWPVTVYLNHFDPGDELHRANRSWLARHVEAQVTTDLQQIVDSCSTAVRSPPER